jgi:hypothetical protein
MPTIEAKSSPLLQLPQSFAGQSCNPIIDAIAPLDPVSRAQADYAER